jgi:hypothetical protein
MVCSDTYVEHERFDIPIVGSNFGKLFRLLISVPNVFAFGFRTSIKSQKKSTKKVLLSIAQKSVHVLFVGNNHSKN